MVFPAMLLALPCMALFGVVPGAFMFALVGFFQGASESFASMGGQVLVLEASGAERSAIGSAVLEVVGMATAAITSVLAPIVYGSHGSETLFGGYAAFGVVVVVVAALRTRSIPADLPR